MRLRLKTKLVLAITGMVFAVVAALSFVYISQLVKQRIDEVYRTGDFVTREIFNASRVAIGAEFAKPPVAAESSSVQARAVAGLQGDPNLDALARLDRRLLAGRLLGRHHRRQ